MTRDARPHRRRFRPLAPRVRAHAVALALAVAAIAPTTLLDRSSLGQPDADDRPGRDVTAFGLRADPGTLRVDPVLPPSAARPLRNLLPGHGLTLLGASSRRLVPNESITCDLGAGRTLRVTLLDPLGDGGKVHLVVTLLAEGQPRPVFVTDVHTPADQLVFLDKALADSDARLLIGVGAR